MQIARSVHPVPGEHERQARLLGLVDGFAKHRIAVVGDIVADEFLTGQISRVSREAPVLILRYDATRIVPGGGGNAANNVAALGGRVELFGLVGQDEAGRALVKSFPGTVPVSYTHLRAHETRHDLVCRLLLEKKKDDKKGFPTT